MKTFKCCPCCGNPLLNEVMTGIQEVHRRSCMKRLDHKFTTTIDSKRDEIVTMGIEISPQGMVRFQWNFKNKTAFVAKGPPEQAKETAVYLPYFEPDLSDYWKLVNKLRTYITFS